MKPQYFEDLKRKLEMRYPDFWELNYAKKYNILTQHLHKSIEIFIENKSSKSKKSKSKTIEMLKI